jgi:hypothetical protein
MSRYEITDDGRVITITEPNGIFSVLEPTDHGHCIDDASIGAIRQQQSEIEELTAERDLQREQFRETMERLFDDIRSLTAERDQLRARLADSECDLKSTKAQLNHAEEVMPKLFEHAELLSARLAAVDAAPTVATVCIAPSSDFQILKYSRYDIPQINGTELIARPAKDGGA